MEPNAGTDLVPTEQKWRLDAFDKHQKSRFISLFAEGQSLNAICNAIGISRGTLEYHKRRDRWFKSCLDACRSVHCDELEAVSLENGKLKEGFADRSMYLKAYRPELYRTREVTGGVEVSININQDALARALEREGITHVKADLSHDSIDMLSDHGGAIDTPVESNARAIE